MPINLAAHDLSRKLKIVFSYEQNKCQNIEAIISFVTKKNLMLHRISVLKIMEHDITI